MRRARREPGCPTGPKPARFYRPPGFDPTRFGFAPGDAFAVLYFLHLIRWKYIQWEADEHGYSRLKWAYLERVVDRDLIPMLRTRLLNNGVIEWTRRSSAGPRARVSGSAPRTASSGGS